MLYYGVCYVCIDVHFFVYMWAEARGGHWISCYDFLLEASFSLTLELGWLRTRHSKPPVSILLPLLLVLRLQTSTKLCPTSHMDTRDLNQVLMLEQHAFLPTEPPPHPLSLTLFCVSTIYIYIKNVLGNHHSSLSPRCIKGHYLQESKNLIQQAQFHVIQLHWGPASAVNMFQRGGKEWAREGLSQATVVGRVSRPDWLAVTVLLYSYRIQ